MASPLGGMRIAPAAVGATYMAVSGLPEPRSDHAERIAEWAHSMQREIAGPRQDPQRNRWIPSLTEID
jgi:hypothetical protein